MVRLRYERTTAGRGRTNNFAEVYHRRRSTLDRFWLLVDKIGEEERAVTFILNQAHARADIQEHVQQPDEIMNIVLKFYELSTYQYLQK